MAVKHKVVDYEERPINNSDCMSTLLRLLDKFRNEPESLPQGQDLIRFCESIVQALGALVIPREASAISSFAKDILNIQDFLANVCISGPCREQLIYVILKQLYNAISQPKSKPGPAMSVVLQLVDTNYLPFAVNLILDNGHSEINIEQALMTLCYWLSQWAKTPNLGECILVFMQGLESQKRFDILINVTLNYVETFFKLLQLPAFRPPICPIVLYMLTRMQSNPEAFHKIVVHVPHVVNRIKQDTSESAQTDLQDIINVCKALTQRFSGYELYDTLEPVFNSYPPSTNYITYLNCAWWSDDENQYIAKRLENDKVGLNNLGNTCYMNSVLQALFMTKLFSNNVLINEHRWPLINKLQVLFALLQFSQCRSLSPSEILQLARPPGFHPGLQHDSSEFLGYLLDILHEQEKLSLPLRQEVVSTAESGDGISQEAPPPTIVQKAFGGRAETVYKCHACGTESIRADNFRDLQLSFPSDFVEGESVQTLLEYYLKPERLCGDNQYYCERCKGLTDAERVFRVIESPPRLVLTLKHFHYNSASHQRIKLLHTVQYNSVLKLTGASYELYAAVIHCGTSVDSGHYYTYARDGQIWYKFNDSYVTTCSASDLSNLKPPETPYILFYSRQDCFEPSSITRIQLPYSVENVLRLEIAEMEEETRKRQRVVTNVQRFTKKDDPPPPGCGGGGGGTYTSNDRFVC